MVPAPAYPEVPAVVYVIVVGSGCEITADGFLIHKPRPRSVPGARESPAQCDCRTSLLRSNGHIARLGPLSVRSSAASEHLCLFSRIGMHCVAEGHCIVPRHNLRREPVPESPVSRTPVPSDPYGSTVPDNRVSTVHSSVSRSSHREFESTSSRSANADLPTRALNRHARQLSLSFVERIRFMLAEETDECLQFRSLFFEGELQPSDPASYILEQVKTFFASCRISLQPSQLGSTAPWAEIWKALEGASICDTSGLPLLSCRSGEWLFALNAGYLQDSLGHPLIRLVNGVWRDLGGRKFCDTIIELYFCVCLTLELSLFQSRPETTRAPRTLATSQRAPNIVNSPASRRWIPRRILPAEHKTRLPTPKLSTKLPARLTPRKSLCQVKRKSPVRSLRLNGFVQGRDVRSLVRSMKLFSSKKKARVLRVCLRQSRHLSRVLTTSAWHCLRFLRSQLPSPPRLATLPASNLGRLQILFPIPVWKRRTSTLVSRERPTQPCLRFRVPRPALEIRNPLLLPRPLVKKRELPSASFRLPIRRQIKQEVLPPTSSQPCRKKTTINPRPQPILATQANLVRAPELAIVLEESPLCPNFRSLHPIRRTPKVEVPESTGDL